MEFDSIDEQLLLDDSLRQLEFHLVLEKAAGFSVSSLGRELILSSAPRADLYWLSNEHSLIEEMIRLIIEDDSLPFDGLSDIKSKLQKSLIQNAILTTTEFLSILECIKASRLIKSYFYVKENKYPALAENAKPLHDNRLLEKHITDTIDITGEIKDSASRELSRIRAEINSKSGHLRKKLQSILKKVAEDDMVMEEFVTLSEGRFVLPVKVEHKRHISGIIHGYSQTGSTVYLEPAEIFELNNEISLLKNEEKKEIYRILANLTAELGADARDYLRSIDILAHLDSVSARAKYAIEYGGIKPEIWENDEIYMHDIRHPLLVHAKSKEKVKSLSINFSDKIKGHLISGPNAGGKTVALKSIGLNLAMALSGIFPMGVCSTNYRSIFSAIGDHQSIEADLSTFSSQILRLNRILTNCTSNSLILIDEILSGTDPQEGSALAAGIMDTFLELNLFFVVTTHQSALKSYALTRDVIENDSLEFDQDKLLPTYKFLQGVPGNSYAFVLAKNIGMSELVLGRARNYLGSRQTELEESIAVLQKYRSDIEQLREDANQEKQNAEKIRRKFEEKFDEIKTKRREYIDKAKEEAFEIVQKSNALVENAIREIQEEKKSFAEIKKDYNKEKTQLEKEINTRFIKESQAEEEIEDSYKFSKGDSVKVDDSPNIGLILESDNTGRTALVEFNGLKFRLPYTRLKKTKDSAAPLASSAGSHIRFDARSRLDLRGKRADEALNETDEFISHALVTNVPLLTIIHGKGTGALRQVIHDYLKHHQMVKSYRLGELVEGGAGVTVVELK
jgi:DNA mismatch repair protein MutS2